MPIPPLTKNAQNWQHARRNLDSVLHARCTGKIPVAVGDDIKIFIKYDKYEGKVWLSLQPSLLYDHANCKVTVAKRSWQEVTAAIEEILAAIDNSPLLYTFQESSDLLDHDLSSKIPYVRGLNIK